LALDTLALLAISAVWLVLGGGTVIAQLRVNASGLVIVIAAGVLAGVGLGVAARVPALRERLSIVLSPLVRQPMRHPAIALLAAAITAVYWSAQLGVMAALAAVFGVSASPALVVGLMGLPVLIGMLSPVPGGAGIREALMATVARFAGVATGPVILAAITYRLALFAVTPVVWGALRLARAGQVRRRPPAWRRPAND
jgi:uncharacterized membrane protein YbhN (UPF0104 family)